MVRTGVLKSALSFIVSFSPYLDSLSPSPEQLALPRSLNIFREIKIRSL
jgi:hypothetical protein